MTPKRKQPPVPPTAEKQPSPKGQIDLTAEIQGLIEECHRLDKAGEQFKARALLSVLEGLHARLLELEEGAPVPTPKRPKPRRPGAVPRSKK